MKKPVEQSEFGKRLAEARVKRGLSQAQLGAKLGTDGANAGKAVVYGWEKRNHYPRADQLPTICERLNVSADWLLRGVKPEWPLSLDLQQAVSKLDPPGLDRLENVMRAHLSIPAPAEGHIYRASQSSGAAGKQQRPPKKSP